MKLFLIVLAIFIVVLLAVLFARIKVFLAFDGEFSFKVNYLNFCVYDSNKPKKAKKSKKPAKKKTSNAAKKPKAKEENLFVKLKNKLGFTGAIKELCSVAKIALIKLKRLIKHFCFDKIHLDIKVATDNAADTAIQYGTVCSAVYPIAQFLNSVADCSFKSININENTL